MRKFIFVFFVGLTLLSLSLQSCSKDSDSDNQSPIVEEEKYIAPESIAGLTFSYGDASNSLDFTSNSFSPKITQTSGWTVTIVGTPTYTYDRLSKNLAQLHTNYKTKHKENSSSGWFTLEYTNDFLLTFSTSSSGIFSGTKIVSTRSNVLPADDQTYVKSNVSFTLR